MSFTFNTGVPASGNNPSVDQPDMQTNNASTNSILAVDHISFNTSGGGQHKQITFNGNNVPGAQTDPQSVLYTNSGTASSLAELFWRNQASIFQAIPIRAWGTFNPNAISLSQTINVASIVKNAVGNYTVNLNAGICTGTTYGILFSVPMTSFSVGGIPGYQVVSSTQFNLYIRSFTAASGVDLANITFAVLQL